MYQEEATKMAEAIQFIDCTSLNISIDKLGYATLSYTLVSNSLDIELITEFKGVRGYPINVKQEPITEAPQFYTTQVSIQGTRDTT